MQDVGELLTDPPVPLHPSPQALWVTRKFASMKKRPPSHNTAKKILKQLCFKLQPPQGETHRSASAVELQHEEVDDDYHA